MWCFHSCSKVVPKGLTWVQLLLKYILFILTDIHRHLICARHSDLPSVLHQRELQGTEQKSLAQTLLLPILISSSTDILRIKSRLGKSRGKEMGPLSPSSLWFFTLSGSYGDMLTSLGRPSTLSMAHLWPLSYFISIVTCIFFRPPIIHSVCSCRSPLLDTFVFLNKACFKTIQQCELCLWWSTFAFPVLSIDRNEYSYFIFLELLGYNDIQR